MIGAFFIGQGDTLPFFTAQVRDKNGVISLSDVSSLYFVMTRVSTGSVVASALASVLETSAMSAADPDVGRVRYQWSAADTASTGDFAAAFIFVTATGEFSLPRNDMAKVVVEDRRVVTQVT